MGKDKYVYIIKEKVHTKAFEELKQDCYSKEKTEDLKYEDFNAQKYLLRLPPTEARILFRARAKQLKIKVHQAFKYEQLTCRLCKEANEDVCHVVNCQILFGSDKITSTDVTNICTLDNLRVIARRLKTFLSAIKN